MAVHQITLQALHVLQCLLMYSCCSANCSLDVLLQGTLLLGMQHRVAGVRMHAVSYWNICSMMCIDVPCIHYSYKKRLAGCSCGPVTVLITCTLSLEASFSVST